MPATKPSGILLWTPSLTSTPPTPTKSALGWGAGEKPPYETFNYAWEKQSEWQAYLQAFTTFDETYGVVFIGTGHNAITGNTRAVCIGKDNMVVATNGLNSVAIGYSNLSALLTGTKNTMIGTENGQAITSGSQNIAIGYNILNAIDANNFNVALGSSALANGYGDHNVALGYAAGQAATGVEQNENIFIGNRTAKNLSNTSSESSFNVVLGSYAANNSTYLFGQVVIGADAGRTGNISTSVLIGFSASKSLTSIIRSTVLGNEANSLATGTLQQSEVIGYNAALYNTVTDSIIIGSNAAASSSGSPGTTDEAVVIGTEAGLGLTTASRLVLIGTKAGRNMSAGTSNVAIGYEACKAITTGYANTVIGDSALLVGTTAQQNVVMGTDACKVDVAGANNVVLGYQAGFALNGATGCVIIGSQAGSAMVAQVNTIMIGAATTILPASNSIHLGSAAHATFHCLAALNGITASPADLQIDTAGRIGTITSSKVFKKNIKDMEDTSWIYDLRPVNFVYKKDKENTKQYGLIAEEVEKVNKDFVFYKDDKPYTVQYSKLITVLLKEIQNLKKQITKMK